jgi:hypothetical protein
LKTCRGAYITLTHTVENMQRCLPVKINPLRYRI